MPARVGTRLVAGSLRAFHDYVWKNGNIPIALLRWEYLGINDEMIMLDA
jgi:hypothetical protein